MAPQSNILDSPIDLYTLHYEKSSRTESESQNVKTQHPRHEAEGYGGHDDVVDPLAGGFGIGAVGHGISLSPRLIRANPANTLRYVIPGSKSQRREFYEGQFPANCSCSIGGLLLSGIARSAPAGSLSGSFGLFFNNSPYPGVNLAVAKFDGAGNVTASLTFIGSADNTGTPPTPFTGIQTGTYSVNPDGSGTLDFPAVPGQSNHQTYSFVVTDGGSGLLIMQTNRPGSGVSFGVGRKQ